MEQFLFYFTHLGIPLLILLSLIFYRPLTKFGLIAGSLFNIAYLWFFFLWGQWPIVAVDKVKYLLLALILWQGWQLIRGVRIRKKLLPNGILRNLKNSVLLIFGLVFAYLVVRAYQGRIYSEESVSLQFPLRAGEYYIASGGSNQVLNNHFNRGSKSQRFALDINLLGRYGSISSSLGPGVNKDHHVFGKDIYAPCSGKIIELENEVADNSGGNMDVGPGQGQGNFIVIDCDGTVVSLVHLKKNSIQVSLGDQIQAGTHLAQVGNSGFSQEPHLHLQAAEWSKDSLLLGVPMEFDGVLPYRNQIISQ